MGVKVSYFHFGNNWNDMTKIIGMPHMKNTISYKVAYSYTKITASFLSQKVYNFCDKTTDLFAPLNTLHPF